VDQIAFAQATIQDSKVSIAPMFIGGVQGRLSWFSHSSRARRWSPQNDFILYNGRPWNIGIEAGIRYNVGTSIDRD
jgi:hypothetical protein